MNTDSLIVHVKTNYHKKKFRRKPENIFTEEVSKIALQS